MDQRTTIRVSLLYINCFTYLFIYLSEKGKTFEIIAKCLNPIYFEFFSSSQPILFAFLFCVYLKGSRKYKKKKRFKRKIIKLFFNSLPLFIWTKPN